MRINILFVCNSSKSELVEMFAKQLEMLVWCAGKGR